MRKSYLWTLAMIIATSMSGASSLDNDDDDDSKPEETAHYKSGPVKNKIDIDLLNTFPEVERDLAAMTPEELRRLMERVNFDPQGMEQLLNRIESEGLAPPDSPDKS